MAEPAMRVRSFLFICTLTGFHALASAYVLFTQLSCAATATFPQPNPITCAFSDGLEWALLSPAVALSKSLPSFGTDATLLLISVAINSLLQVGAVLLMWRTIQITRRWTGRLPAVTPPPFKHAITRRPQRSA